MQKVVSVQSSAIPLEANHKHSHYSALHHITLLFPTVTGAFQRQDCSVIVTYRERPADSEVKQSIQNIPAILFKRRLPNGVYTSSSSSSSSCLNRNTKRQGWASVKDSLALPWVAYLKQRDRLSQHCCPISQYKGACWVCQMTLRPLVPKHGVWTFCRSEKAKNIKLASILN